MEKEEREGREERRVKGDTWPNARGLNVRHTHTKVVEPGPACAMGRSFGYPRGTTGYYDSALGVLATVVGITGTTKRCDIRLAMGEITPHRPPPWVVRHGY